MLIWSVSRSRVLTRNVWISQAETRLTISYPANSAAIVANVSGSLLADPRSNSGSRMSPIWVSLKIRLTRRYGDSGCSRRSAAFRERSVLADAADQSREMRSDAGGENPDPLAPTLGQDGLAVPVVPSEHLVTTKAGQGHRESGVTGEPGH